MNDTLHEDQTDESALPEGGSLTPVYTITILLPDTDLTSLIR